MGIASIAPRTTPIRDSPKPVGSKPGVIGPPETVFSAFVGSISVRSAWGCNGGSGGIVNMGGSDARRRTCAPPFRTRKRMVAVPRQATDKIHEQFATHSKRRLRTEGICPKVLHRMTIANAGPIVVLWAMQGSHSPRKQSEASRSRHSSSSTELATNTTRTFRMPSIGGDR
jgi:hypothetical protein